MASWMFRSTRRWAASQHHVHLPSHDHSLHALVNSNCISIWICISICLRICIHWYLYLSICICTCIKILFDFVYVPLNVYMYFYLHSFHVRYMCSCVHICPSHVFSFWHGRLWRVPFITWAEDCHQVILFFDSFHQHDHEICPTISENIFQASQLEWDVWLSLTKIPQLSRRIVPVESSRPTVQTLFESGQTISSLPVGAPAGHPMMMTIWAYYDDDDNMSL